MSKSEHIYIGVERLPFRIRWKPIDRGELVALSEEQIADLGTQFHLDINELRRLSHALAIDLSSLPGIGTNLIRASRSKAAARGAKKYDRVRREIAAAERHLRTAIAVLDRLSPNDELGGNHIDDFFTAVRLVHTGHSRLTIGLPVMRKVAKDPEAVLLIAPDDKRRLRDPRRALVLEDIFRFWAGIGRKLSYTTDPVTQKRRGKLIDFVNAVIGCITVSPGGLSGDTIISAIKAFRARTRDGS